MKVGDTIIVAPCNRCKYDNFYRSHSHIVGKKSKIVDILNSVGIQAYFNGQLYTLSACNVRIVEEGTWWKE